MPPAAMGDASTGSADHSARVRIAGRPVAKVLHFQ